MYKKYFRIFLMVNGLFAILFFSEAVRLQTKDAGMTKETECYSESVVADDMKNDEIVKKGYIQTKFIEKRLPEAVSHARVMDETMLVREKVHNLSEAEYNLLLRLVEAEAGGEDMEGKILVANVVFNRVASVKFPNTVTEVILQRDGKGAQFSPVSDGRINSVNVSEETQNAVEHVIYGEDLSQGALYFVARASADEDKLKWFDTCLTPVLTHGGHEFFK